MSEPLPESPLPADLKPITKLVGTVATFYRGAPSGGTATFKTEGYVVAGHPPVLIVGAEKSVTIDAATGRFEVDWVPGNDPDGQPSTVTATFELENGLEFSRTIVVPIVQAVYPPLLDENGQPVVDASGNVVPDTSQAPTYPPVNFFAQAPVPEIPGGEATAPVVLEDTTLFLRVADAGAPDGVATLDERGLLPVTQLIDPSTMPDQSALAYDRSTGTLQPIRVDARWRGAVSAQPTDEGQRGDYFTNLALADGQPILWGCVRSGGPVEDGSSDEAQWLPFGGGSGSGPGGGVVSVAATEPLQSSGGPNPTLTILPATQLRAGAMSAAHFVKLSNIADGATAYSDENAQDAVARMILAGTHVGLSGSYDDQANAFSFRVTAEAGLITGIGADLPLTLGGTATNPQLGINSATASAAGAMTSQMVVKLASIEDGSTKNATNAQLRDRSTHTGVLPVSAVDGLETFVRGVNAKVRTVTADTTLTADDEVVRVNSANPVTVTYPTNAVAAIGVGNAKVVRQAGAGVVTLVGAGVQLNGLTKTAGQNTSVSLLKIAAAEVDLEGGVA